jgi:hypothetical protein
MRNFKMVDCDYSAKDSSGIKTFLTPFGIKKPMIAALNSFEQDETLAWWDPDVLVAANIMPATGLATDYLNVFNEAIMLFGLLPDMPDMIEELLVWQPLTYEQHFRRSGFAAKDLAIAAYNNADAGVKQPFDDLSDATGTLLAHAIIQASDLLSAPDQLAQFVRQTNPMLQSAIETLDSLIHGGSVGGDQVDIDALFD